MQAKKSDTILNKLIRNDQVKLENKLMRAVKEIAKTHQVGAEKKQKIA